MKQCFFCQKNIDDIDYKNVDILKHFLSSQYKILPRKKTLVCAKHQRVLAKAVKRARQMSLIPTTLKH
ncbi:MAG TPA: 30S ribosomal protein S18 [Candidatus Paceibacterota bacterium]|jgi:small subunit ribosomal protein S18|nr:30S ribosomal protein S18 [Candidatus Paceibacterota bacterium]